MGRSRQSNHLSAPFQLECSFLNVVAKVRQRILGEGSNSASHTKNGFSLFCRKVWAGKMGRNRSYYISWVWTHNVISQLRWLQVITPGTLLHRGFPKQLIGAMWVPPHGVQAAESTRQVPVSYFYTCIHHDIKS